MMCSLRYISVIQFNQSSLNISRIELFIFCNDIIQSHVSLALSTSLVALHYSFVYMLYIR